ncbi:zinc ribbon domain-containing protein [Acetonema longum]|uniref:Zinc-ribbon domain-containing protein n=1 Tax=Acetonema longum DSM 6540 TaxID=1009370 RepID=F7NML7_9FIRM|nr:zinc ribbon domain-containing protein [Acetonema longum]EGO62709.1 hypothetical protein ALO_16741 [Acetonema longum DSM 6540]
MFCSFCGVRLAPEAKFCHQCGAAVQAPPAAGADYRHCRVTLVQVGEKWSLFGKEIFEFRAVQDDGVIVAASDKITLTGFEYEGPSEKNKKHQAALDRLTTKLYESGWQKTKDKPGKWYELVFQQPVS